MFNKKEEDNRTKKKFESIDRAIGRLESRIWELENPQLFNIGQVVRTEYTDRNGESEVVGIITDHNIRNGWGFRCRDYKIMKKDGKIFEVAEHKIIKLLEQDAFNCIEED